MIQGTAVSVSGTVPVLIAQADNDGTFVIVENLGGPAVILGGSAVTTTVGYQLGSAAVLPGPIPLYSQEALYGVTASGTATVHVLKTSVNS
jgi:hypothetical protein